MRRLVKGTCPALRGARAQTMGAPSANATAGTSETAKRTADVTRVFKGMLGPQGLTDTVTSKAPFIAGKATERATKATMDRSTVFENWCHRSPTGLYMSKLGCTTCKMPKDMSESEDSLQLQIIKGLNVFEIDGSASDVYQSVSKSFNEVFNAFELDREGFVFVLRIGVIRQPPAPADSTDFDVNNTAPIRNRAAPALERFKASSLPGQNLKSGYNIEEMQEEQLQSLNLRRVGPRHAAAVTPTWLDASLSSVAFHMNIETIDVLLLEGLHSLYDGRPLEEVEKDLFEVFEWAESVVAQGSAQWYGISSPTLAPPLPRVYPPLPPDAMLPDKYKKPYTPPETMNVHRIMQLAAKAGGGETKHHMRYLSYPFNLTQSQALGTPLPYDTKNTLCSVAKHYGLTTLSHNPVEAPDLQDKAQRYHRFPMTTDLKQLRNNFFHVCEKVVMKEREIKPYVDKMTNQPPLHHLFVGSVYAVLQLQLCNAFQFENWVNFDVLPPLRKVLGRIREGGSRDIKDWSNAFDMLITDMLRFRLQMFQHKHGMKAIEIDHAIDRHSPTLKQCAIITQKAVNFATHGADVTLCGFHQTRYFHEATELNPLVGKKVPWEELKALCDTKEVSYCDWNPPHPYMLEPFPANEANFSGQKTQLREMLVPVDAQKPEWPDIPKELEQQQDRPPGEEQPPNMFGHEGRKGSAAIANYGVTNWGSDEYLSGKLEPGRSR
jgi:hypothetical protein